MMKIILLILLSICTLLKADYPRYKIRGPPPHRRSPPSQQFSKKWHQGGPFIKSPQGIQQAFPQGIPHIPQGIPHIHQGFPHMSQQALPPGMQFSLRGPPTRQKPVNQKHGQMYVGAGSVPTKYIQNVHNQNVQRPVTPPNRIFWKNPLNNVNFPQENVNKPQVTSTSIEKQKPFRSAPSLPMQETEYHIQTNQIPQSHINPIKQIGEKGPIHTIPAPNLSLKDKPAHIEEFRSKPTFQQNNPQELRNEYVQNNHQEVRNEYVQHDYNNFGQKAPQSTYVTIQKSHEYQVTEPPDNNEKLHRLHQEHQKNIQRQIQKQIEQMQKQHADEEAQNHQILLASEPISLQQNFENNPSTDIILNNNLSPKDLYQLVSATYPQVQQGDNVHLFQPESSFIDHFPHDSTQIASEKVSFRPEYHSFNYDEQAHQKSLSKKGMSSLVSATYNLGSDPKEISSRNSDSSDTSDSVQNYFDSRSDEIENKIESDAGSKKEIIEGKLIGTYYSSLPNKEAAERLAQLQSAGKINSNLMKLSTGKDDSKEPMTILIPDDYEGGSDRDEIKHVTEQNNEYDEDNQDEMLASEESAEFGHRIQPKKRAE